MATKTKVLILGATGHISQIVTAALNSRHPEVALRLTSSREAGVESLRAAFPSAEVMSANWNDESSLVAAMRGVDKLLLVIPDGITDDNVVTPNIIRAVKRVGGISQIVRLIMLPPDFDLDELTPAQRASNYGPALHGVAKSLLDASGLPVTYVNVAAWIMFNLVLFAADIKKRRLPLPASSDAPRPWLSETDIAEVHARVLADPAAAHVGHEYLITSEPRYTFPQVAAILSQALGEKVTYYDDDASLRQAMGPYFDTLIAYWAWEVPSWKRFPATQTLQELLGRPPVTLQRYVEEHKFLFV